MKTVKTKKGTELPLLDLRGKDYLQVAHRIQWFAEEEVSFKISTEFLLLTEKETVARVTVETFNLEGKPIKTAQATKRENSAGFGDHTEKAETGALGRALVQLGYGTQFALADLDEGDRLADSPVVDAKKSRSDSSNRNNEAKDAINKFNQSMSINPQPAALVSKPAATPPSKLAQALELAEGKKDVAKPAAKVSAQNEGWDD